MWISTSPLIPASSLTNSSAVIPNQEISSKMFTWVTPAALLILYQCFSRPSTAGSRQFSSALRAIFARSGDSGMRSGARPPARSKR